MSCEFFNKSTILKGLTDSQIIILRTVNSTNQYIIDNVSAMKSGDVCVSECQTHGRGKQGNIWFSPLCQNIYLSIYWKFYQLKFSTSDLSLTISIILAEILQSLGLIHIKIKWPNDLYFNKRKIAGVLVEILTTVFNSNIKDVIYHVIIGIGVNLFMDVDTVLENSVNLNWISLKQAGVNVDQNFLVTTIVNFLRQRLKLFDYQGYFPCLNNWRFF